MAKRKPIVSLSDMEKELGYGAHDLVLPSEPFTRLYSDLNPVIDSAYEMIRREYEEHHKKNNLRSDACSSKNDFQDLTHTMAIERCQHSVIIKQIRNVGSYRFAVDIHYGFGLHLPFLFSQEEVHQTISVARMHPYVLGGHESQLFLTLPKEIREQIYTLALPHGTWCMPSVDILEKVLLTGGIGDPRGFLFPLSKNLGLLSVNRHTRQEALPLAYRTVAFHLDDMDDLVKLLVAVGETGWDNIETLYFPWESRSDLQRKWEDDPDADDNSLQLPNLHVVRCVQLLKQCRRLRSLGLYFESDLIDHMDPKIFRSDPGIQALRSVRVKKVEILSLGHESLEQYPHIRWLKAEMEQTIPTYT